MALTQSQMTAAVADRAEMSMADARRALAALDEIVLEELGNAQKVRSRRACTAPRCGSSRLRKSVGGATRRPARRSTFRPSRQASMSVRGRSREPKAALPSVQKARRRLAATNGRAPR